MADSKLSALSAIASPVVSDIMYIVDVSLSASNKITVTSLLDLIRAQATDWSAANQTFGGVILSGNTSDSGSGGGFYTLVPSTGRVILGASGALEFRVNDTSSGAQDLKLTRLAANVAKFTDGSSGFGWLQQGGRSRVSGSAVTNDTVNLANITGLSATLLAGRAYSGVLALKVSNTTAVDGLRLDFDGGAATMTLFEAGVTCAGFAAATFSVTQSSALGTDIIATTMADTSTKWITIHFGMVVNAAGTFIPRIALEADSGGVISVHPGSYMLIEETP